MKEQEMEIIADFIDEAIKNYQNEEKLSEIAKKVKEMCDAFPLYKELREKYEHL